MRNTAVQRGSARRRWPGPALVYKCLALRETGLILPVGGRVGDDQPPAIFGQRKKRQRVVPAQPDLRLGMVDVALDLYIGQHKMLGIGAARKRDGQLLAHRAVRPVAAEDPVGLDLLDPVAVAQPRRHARTVQRQPDQGGVALDRHPQPGDVLFEDPFGLVLRHPQNIRVARVERTEIDMGDRPAVAISLDAGDALAGGEEIIGEPHQFERLDGPRVDCDRPRLHRAVRVFVDQATLDAVAGEFMRRDQSGRTRSDDQHALPVDHGYFSID
jgi:hypothetical protein